MAQFSLKNAQNDHFHREIDLSTPHGLSTQWNPSSPQVASRSPKNTPQSQGSLHKAWGGSTAPSRVESGGSRIPNLGKNIKNIILPFLKNPTNKPNTVPVSQYKGITVPAADPPVVEVEVTKLPCCPQAFQQMDFYCNFGLMENRAPSWGGPA